MPKLSIITINLNNRGGLTDTAKSVVAQTWTDYEWIIIDGGSVDGSVGVIREYVAQTDKIAYWCSEKDDGVYSAMNKGIDKASGEYCWFLNSGDYAHKNTTLEEIFANEFDEDIVYGNIYSANKELYTAGRVNRTKERNVRSPILWVDSPAIHHQASFIKRELFTKLGGYSTNFKFASDTEFTMNAIFNNNASIRYINTIFAFYDRSGMTSSIDDETQKTISREYGKIMVDIFPNSYLEIYAKFVARRKMRKLFSPFLKFSSKIRRWGMRGTTRYYINKLFGRKRKTTDTSPS
ncbi:MAG: glycosyltransferase [Bacteroidales bacterium]|jgi:glycosyltransferase involved in cell wall biosynthesis|nr:glycosyltransferase [Bacteroidales bacterium]